MGFWRTVWNGVTYFPHMLLLAAMSKYFYHTGTEKLPENYPASWFDLEAKDIDGNLIKFSDFKDIKKGFLVINSVSK
jgi:hypothetical protein